MAAAAKYESMYRISYPILFGLSYFGTRFWGLEKTILGFKNLGMWWRKFGFSFDKTPERLRHDLAVSYGKLPLAVRCLDQAVVTWHLLNLHGHAAQMKIGINLTPFMSHAWVECGAERFVDFVYIPDMQVVADYPAWET